MWAQALGFSGLNFCLSIRFWEVNFAWVLTFFDKKNLQCLIKGEKSDLLAEKFQFWHSKIHENFPGH